ncbi:TetR/AcrR family transcriptional regulator [Curtobacterium pusillum]|uniref:TetR/AcrR family transcriptional regulator n=1 Tax=Curtobacterium pusillum TaxID=69373 RepID=UPI00119E6A29|nr:TetR/AcrR family transcriptional regulator [Curtobacterium pusillum]
MPRTAPRGGPETRARIAETASGMFVERGFDAVTVAQVAQAAGVSSVTVFKHFPRKEDLFLDRSDETIDLFRASVDGVPLDEAVTALEALTTRLVDDRAPVSGLAPGSEAFFRTIAGSPALQARARELAADAQAALAEATGDELLAAFFVAGYATVFVGTARRIIADEDRDAVAAAHRAGLDRLFHALRTGVAPAT